MYENNIKNTNKNIQEANVFIKDLSNPLKATRSTNGVNITNYTQELPRPSYDEDYHNIILEANSVNNMVPQKLPIYNFNTEEINGERYYKPDGTPLLIREYDGDVIRDYYIKASDYNKIDRILEHDKDTGLLKTKIEAVDREGSGIKSNITLFDVKINNKYILMQLTQDGTVNNITEFSANGKNFKTVYRGYDSTKVVKYIAGKDTKENGFVMIDCIFDKEGKIARIKNFSNRKKVTISYENNKKSINTKSTL